MNIFVAGGGYSKELSAVRNLTENCKISDKSIENVEAIDGNIYEEMRDVIFTLQNDKSQWTPDNIIEIDSLSELCDDKKEL